jgi:hypothetical protein
LSVFYYWQNSFPNNHYRQGEIIMLRFHISHKRRIILNFMHLPLYNLQVLNSSLNAQSAHLIFLFLVARLSQWRKQGQHWFIFCHKLLNPDDCPRTSSCHCSYCRSTVSAPNLSSKPHLLTVYSFIVLYSPELVGLIVNNAKKNSSFASCSNWHVIELLYS